MSTPPDPVTTMLRHKDHTDVGRGALETCVSALPGDPPCQVYVLAEALWKAILGAQEDKAQGWDEGQKAGEAHERDKWHWSAGSMSRAVHGLKEYPERPTNPYREDPS